MAAPISAQGLCIDSHFCWENPRPQPRLLQRIRGTGPNDIWVVGESGTAMHFDGSAWRFVPTTDYTLWFGFYSRAPNQAWVVGSSGTIMYWDGTRFTTQAHPGDPSRALLGVWGIGSTVWVVGGYGTILKWDGTAWTSMISGTTEDLFSIWGSSENDVWVVGRGGVACHYGGSAFTCKKEFNAAAFAVTGTSRDNVWALGSGDQAWRWDGTKWNASPRAAPGVSIWDAIAFSPNDVRAVDQDGNLHRFNGTTWTASPLGAGILVSLWGASSNDLYAVGLHGQIHHYDGTTWQPRSAGFLSDITAMWGSSDRDVWIFTADSKAHHFDGVMWSEVLLPSVGYSAGGRAANDLWVGSDGGRVLHYDGSRFTVMDPGVPGEKFQGLYAAAADRVVFGGNSSVVIWDGARFVKTFTLTYPATKVWAANSNDIWIGLPGCQYYRYDGAKFTLGAVPSCTGNVNGISGSSASDVYVSADSSAAIFHFDGSVFKTVTLPTTGFVTSLFATKTRVFATTNGFQIVTGHGTTWEVMSNTLLYPTHLTEVAGFANDKVWFGGDGGAVLSYRP